MDRSSLLARTPFLTPGGVQPPPEDPQPELPRSLARHPQALALPPACRQLLGDLLRLRVITPSQVGCFLDQAGDARLSLDDAGKLGRMLVEEGLLTNFQLGLALAGAADGLVVGGYRILSRLASGSMGVIFRGEHLLLGRQVAIKMLPIDEDCHASSLERFYAEMQVLADLHHPNIVRAYDAGRVEAAAPEAPAFLYLVLELLPGGDLEQYVRTHGPVPISLACEWIRQAACGLQEAHDHHLIHRDVKPSNLLLTREGQVRLVDFGLVRQFSSRLTDPRSLIGTLEYMAPEQSVNPPGVGPEADIYGLGATLFWLLTGEPPYPLERNARTMLNALREKPPRRVRDLRPEVPEELDQLVAQMTDRDLTRRPATPLTIMNALLPFAVGPESPELGAESTPLRTSARTPLPAAPARILVVDDDESICRLVRKHLHLRGYECNDARDASTALALLREGGFDLLVLDLYLPDLNGYEVCELIRERPPCPHFKILITGPNSSREVSQAFARGADDFLAKPFSIDQLESRIRHALANKGREDRADLLADQLQKTNRQLEQTLRTRSAHVRSAQNAVLLALAKVGEFRDGETPNHLLRLQRYTRRLAQTASVEAPWAGLVDTRFLEQLEACVPLHDIGKIALPETVLSKAGRLSVEERTLVATHTLIGDQLIESLRAEHGEALPFLGMAGQIVRSHHEHFDGTGYPDGLVGEAIPHVARLVALADVYDALRRKRFHKAPLPHDDVVRIILHESPGKFDPVLLRAFSACHPAFAAIFRELPD